MPERDWKSWRKLFATRKNQLETPFVEDVSDQESETRPLPKVTKTEQIMDRIWVVEARGLLPQQDFSESFSCGVVDTDSLQGLAEDTKRLLGLNSNIKKNPEAKMAFSHRSETAWISLETGEGSVKYVFHSQGQVFCEMMAKNEDSRWQKVEVDEELVLSEAEHIVNLVEEGGLINRTRTS